MNMGGSQSPALKSGQFSLSQLRRKNENYQECSKNEAGIG